MANNSDDNRLRGGVTDVDKKSNDISEGQNVLQEYVQSLSDEDKELIKTVPFEELKDLINGSLSIPEVRQPISRTIATKRGNKKRIMEE